MKVSYTILDFSGSDENVASTFIWSVGNETSEPILSNKYDAKDRAISRVKIDAENEKRIVAIGNYDGSITLNTYLYNILSGTSHNVTTKKLVNPTNMFNINRVKTIDISPDCCKYIVSGDSSDNVYVWNIETGNITTLQGHQGNVIQVVYSKCKKYIASTSSDETVCIWDADKSTLLHKLVGHNGQVLSVAFNSDSSYLVSCSFNGNVIIWNVNTGELIDKNSVKRGLYSVKFVE